MPAARAAVTIPRVSTGELLTRWTVRLALLLYAMTLALRLSQPRRRAAARILWTTGCGLFLVHVACAFHFFHGWSHADALRETARQTGEFTGVYSGAGLWLNYLFTFAWALDVIWWWGAGLDAYDRRSGWVTVPLHAFLAFMAFNGTVVFEAGATRWLAAGAAMLLLVLLVTRRRRAIDRPRPAGPRPPPA